MPDQYDLDIALVKETIGLLTEKLDRMEAEEDLEDQRGRPVAHLHLVEEGGDDA